MASSELSPSKEKMVKSNVMAQSWTEFTQGTTLHGLKYVFGASSVVRRLIWLLIVLAAIFCFVLHIYTLTREYQEYKIHSDVTVEHMEGLPFPAVTICNRNNFRLTKAADVGVYGFINAVYSHADNVTGLDFTRFDTSDVDAETFIREAAHQKDDFIVRCSWRGQPCDVRRGFLPVLTGMGLCYTFNAAADDSDILVVDEPGYGSGLSVVLNLEEYEYTLGSQGDVGVKMLLHGQSEYPAVEELGFAAASGTHTLVGVQHSVVESLASPYGSCSDAATPLSDCLLTCRTRRVIDRCACREAHVKQQRYVSSDVCSLEAMFRCAATVEGLFSKINNCQCLTPCTSTAYDASLSYASLSPRSIERAVLTDTGSRSALWDRQSMARETFQRVDEVTSAQDQQEYADMVTYTTEMDNVLQDFEEQFTEDKLLGLLQALSAALEQDFNAAEAEYTRIFELTKDFTYFYPRQVYPLSTFADKLVENLGLHYQSTDVLVDQLIACEEANETTAACDLLFTDSRKSLEKSFQDGSDAYESFQDVYNKYTRIIDDIYTGSPIGASNVTEHQRCQSNLDSIAKGENSEIYPAVLKALEDVLATGNNTAYVDSVQALSDLCNDTSQLNEANAVIPELVPNCAWFLDSYDQWKIGFNAAGNAILNESVQAMLQKAAVVDQVLPDVSVMLDVLQTRANSIVNATDLYLSGETPKLQLHDSLRPYQGVPLALTDEAQGLREQLESLNEGFQAMKERLQKGYQQMLGLKIPVLKTEQYDERGFISLVGSLDDPVLHPLWLSLYNAPNQAEITSQMIAVVIDKFLRPTWELHGAVEDIPTKLATVMRQQQTRLDRFAGELSMDDKFFGMNFLKVDVYYRELKIHKTTERAALDLADLLFHIGGVMILFIGASVITLFEFLDYIIMCLFCRRCCGSNRTSNDPI